MIESKVLNFEFSNIRSFINISIETVHPVIKEFRFSNDKILWSDYHELKTDNDGIQRSLQQSFFNPDKPLYFELKLTQINENEQIDLNSDIDFRYVSSDESEEVKLNKCELDKLKSQMGSPCCETPKIVFNNCGCGGNLFDPYSILNNSVDIYKQMSALVSNMFGISVQYFKVEPDARTADYILLEYSLSHVVDKQCMKVLIPNNQLPTKEIKFNPIMMDYQVNFEVNIVKSEFQSVFGEDAKPKVHDYMYMESYVNKMYEVNSVSDADDFAYASSYWRVGLKIYEIHSSTSYDKHPDLLKETEEIIFCSEDKFRVELSNNTADVRNQKQLNDITTIPTGEDNLRSYIANELVINELDIYNRYVTIARFNYDLSSVNKNKKAINYKSTVNFGNTSPKMISFWFKLNSDANNSFMRIGDKFEIGVLQDRINVKINNSSFDYFGTFRTNDGIKHKREFNKDTWYGVIFAMNESFSNTWVYELKKENIEENNYLEPYFEMSNELPTLDIKSGNIELLGSNILVTNIRIWKEIVKKDNHNILLSQYLVKESHLCDLIDNAQKEWNVKQIYGA